MDMHTSERMDTQLMTCVCHYHYCLSRTGGSDGFVNIWDPFNKKRLCQFHRYPTDISSMCFSQDGNMMAIAVSPILPEEGEDGSQKDYVIIRHVSDGETQPK